ncbi:MAG: ABC transporter permease [Acidobacteriota bacterium]
MTSLIQDLRHGLRLLAKSPAFAVAAILVLALGIGANTAIFSVVHAVLLQPLPYPNPDRLVVVWHVPPADAFPGLKTFSVSTANFIDWEKQTHVFDKMGATGYASLNLTGGGAPEAVPAARVTENFFSVFRARPILGRTFTPAENVPGAGNVVVLTHSFWKSRFGGDASIVGREIRFDDRPYRVVGVMGPDATNPEFARVWVPAAWDAKERAVRNNHNDVVYARLKDGVDMKSAQAEMNLVSERLARQYPADDAGWGAAVVSLREARVGEVRPLLLVLLAAVAFVLLIACANVANLMLARTLARRKEIAVRSALGASRSRLLRQLVAEALLLSLIGGGLGLFLSKFGMNAIVAFLADQLPRSAEIGLSAPVLVFTLVVAVLTGVLAGLAPAWKGTTTNLADSLKQGLGRTDSDSGGNRTRGILVVAEVALSLVLLIGAGLLIRSLWLLQRVNPGFDPKNITTMSISLPKVKEEERARAALFFERVLERVRALPGVESVGATSELPLTGTQNWPIAIEGRPPLEVSQQPNVVTAQVAGDYFRTLRIPLRRGRLFTSADTATTTGVIVINEAMAKRFWPNENAIGKRLFAAFAPDKSREVIGIVGDVKLRGLEHPEPVPAMYQPLSQIPGLGMDFAIRSRTAGIGPAAVAAVHELDPNQPVLQVGSMDNLVATSLSRQRLGMVLLAGFAALALVLAAVGIYSVLSYAVRHRGREIGIRMALGAGVGDVLRLIVFQGMRPALIGIVIGLAAALALGRGLASLVFGISAADPATLAAVAGLLAAVALVACLVPALRAARIDPIRALRDE